MMKQIVFASSNINKVKEIKALLPDATEILGLSDIHFYDEIDETGDTLKENAAIKARVVYDFCHLPCFADDSGLMVNALNGRPGVKSARYAGEPADHNANIDKLLYEMQEHTDRSATFRTVICLKDAKGEQFFEGEVKGRIIHERRGDGGFGYDPVFIPDGYDTTFAEMTPEEKNSISHRKRAIAAMKAYLTSGAEQ